MKCIIPGANVKVFGRSIHSLSKIGDELYLEPLQHGLAIRTVNSSRSAYACFVFAPSFFQYYDDGTSTSSDSEEENVKCKIGMKPCLTVFKSLSSLEKTVDRCKITLDVNDARLIFQMYCKHGIVKTHNLAFIECETLQAVFSKDLCPNSLTAHSRLLADVVVNFQTTQEEVTLMLRPEKVSLKNYVDDEPDPHKMVHTELNLDPDEFENFQVGIDTDVTFCLKELRAILSFTEAAQLPLSIHFEGPGKPIVFSMDSDPSFEANFVLATLADHAPQMGESQHSTAAPTPNVRSAKRPTSTASRCATARNRSAVMNRPPPSQNVRSMQSNRPTPHLVPDETETNTVINKGTSKKNDPQESRKTKERSHSKIESAFEEFMNDDFDDVMLEAANRTEAEINDNTAERDQNEADKGHKEADKGHKEADNANEEDDPPSPVIPYHHNKNMNFSFMNSEHLEKSSEEDEDDDLVPGTPPSKKFKSLFFGLSQSQSVSSQPAVVLAEDTDDED